MSDKEHATASLWNSEVLSVKNAVGEPIPEFAQQPEEGTNIPSVFHSTGRRGRSPKQPAGPIAASNCTEGKHELATRVIQSCSESCVAERLAGSSSAKKVNCMVGPLFEVVHVPWLGHPVAMREDRARERLDLGEERWLPPER
jgi:hypothetical protein